MANDTVSLKDKWLTAWLKDKWITSSNKQRISAIGSAILVTLFIIRVLFVPHSQGWSFDSATCTTPGLIREAEGLDVKGVKIINAGNFRDNRSVNNNEYKCVADVDASDGVSTQMYYSWFKGVTGKEMIRVSYQ